MNIEEIRDNAPDGAMYFYMVLDYVNYYNVIDDVVLFWCNNKWLESESFAIDDIYLLKPL